MGQHHVHTGDETELPLRLKVKLALAFVVAAAGLVYHYLETHGSF